MPHSTKLLLVLGLVGASVACSTARDPAKGFRLAGSGDVHRGELAFLEFGCNGCHQVAGANMTVPKAQAVKLGGSVIHEPSDGYLVTAIINPAYHAAHYPAIGGAQAGNPQMPDFASRMTLQQLTDIVAYLQTRYALLPNQVPAEYP